MTNREQETCPNQERTDAPVALRRLGNAFARSAVIKAKLNEGICDLLLSGRLTPHDAVELFGYIEGGKPDSAKRSLTAARMCEQPLFADGIPLSQWKYIAGELVRHYKVLLSLVVDYAIIEVALDRMFVGLHPEDEMPVFGDDPILDQLLGPQFPPPGDDIELMPVHLAGMDRMRQLAEAPSAHEDALKRIAGRIGGRFSKEQLQTRHTPPGLLFGDLRVKVHLPAALVDHAVRTGVLKANPDLKEQYEAELRRPIGTYTEMPKWHHLRGVGVALKALDRGIFPRWTSKSGHTWTPENRP